ncbi:PREDICTED: uncharacterized protein LOC104753452 [Camelina sativa]|uniref:Uncharacterized protein LOC104753452 n=1 Tax=Camelina sativa TaxID=90675 RepID=A0ABM0WP63_CAMSA|nr:PREDICTED: uncharacterized protein LOC104753452 [Camelina sativa]
MCNTFSCFDHTVLVNGTTPLKEEEKAKTSFDVRSEEANIGLRSIDGEHVASATWSNGCGQRNGSAMDSRKLEDIDDEEFDIPPLYDDTEFEREEIPDLDFEDDGKELCKGKLFANKEDCQIALAIYAIKNKFHFKQTTTKKDSFVVSCTGESCEWRVLASEMKESGYYEIRKADLEHTCPIETRRNYLKKLTSRVIAAVFKSKYSDPSKGPGPLDLQQMVLENLRVGASYSKCWRAKGKALDGMFGSDDESFEDLPAYLHVLKEANPGTVTDLKTEVLEDGGKRFLYMFLAFGASIEGFCRLRRVIVVDGTHLNGNYNGVLLTASGQDANFQVFPLAFAVVDSENDDAWTWFFEKLERIIADSKTLTIISDRNVSIYTAKKKVYPLAHHGACIVHLARNVNARFHNKGLVKLVTKAAFAYKVTAFQETYRQIKAKNSNCATYLDKIGAGHWSRAYFQGNRYNWMTSNIAEPLNKALGKGRSSHIVELLKFIRAMLTRWFSAGRKKSAKHQGLTTP